MQTNLNEDTRTVTGLVISLDQLSLDGITISEKVTDVEYPYVYTYPTGIVSFSKAICDIVTTLMKALMSDKDLFFERYMPRQMIIVNNPSGDVIAQIFKNEFINGNTTAKLTSEMLGIVIIIEDTGKNFVFDVRALKDGGKHAQVEKILQDMEGHWTKRIQEVIIRTTWDPPFNHHPHEGETVYGYIFDEFFKNLLEFVPVKNLLSISPVEILKSFQSHDNKGVIIGTVFDIDVYVRLIMDKHNLSEDQLTTQRRANALGTVQNMMLVRNVETVRTEFLIYSKASPFGGNMDKEFDYAEEQEKMHAGATALYLGLWQYVHTHKQKDK